ncbi:PAS domain-containing protein [Hymenobacter glacieicola]|uniref:PAS domain S-box protein n=1 Tax=Hymenobacter glacieicola TaxID=1562124 RepID=A0ABQ1WLD4_9BACT|nr:PAS domain-containing protein [Hymenobacter glacieicola]GGG35816.1 hypothetical protein GCM10011378_10110 [Hymenobacter glacieicola]
MLSDSFASIPIAEPDTLLRDLLAVSLTGVNLLSPLYGPSGELDDFTLDYLNPAAQRITGKPERPEGTARTVFPDIFTNGVFDFYRRVYETGEAGRYELYYRANGYDHCFRLAARRSGERLIVSFTDTADQDQTAAEMALRQSQAAEQAARAEVERQRQRFYDLLMQLPAHVAVHEGPDQAFTLVNPYYQRLAAGRDLLGQPIRDAWPELVSQGILPVLDQVYQTGEPFIGTELPFLVNFTRAGQPQQLYFNAFFLPLRDSQGQVTGVLDFSYNVTEQVLARRQLEQLNQELEARVQARTQEAQAARAEAEAQQTELQRVFEQAPVAIAIVRGPDFTVELANPVMEALWGRPLAQVIGRPHFDALPDAREQGLEQIFTRVLHTGEPFTAVEMPVALARGPAGQLVQGYFNCTWHPLRDGQGHTTGLILVGVEVTAQVRARQQAEALQAELLAVARRQAQERETLYQVFEQTPGAICIQRGPEHRYEYVNPAYQALFSGREFRGRSVPEALPEAAEQGFTDLLDQVYRTGETFHGTELPVVLHHTAGQPGRTIYFNFTYQALRENGEIVGVSTFAYDVTEQVLARQAREVQRRKLYTLFEQAPAGICVLAGPDLEYEFVNPSYQQLLPGRALVGRPILEALPEVVGTPVAAILRAVYDTGETHQEPALLIPLAGPDGRGLEDRYFSFVYQARRDEHQRVDGVLAFVFEVTEQVLARRQAEESAQQVQAVVAGAPFLIGVYEGPEFRIQLANQAMQAAIGKGPDIIGRRYADVLPELENQAVFEQLHQVFSTGEALHLRRQQLKVVMNGTPQTFYYNYSFIPLRDTQGQVYGILNTAADVTDLVLARRRADEAAAELRLLTAHAPAFLYRTDAAGHITYVNDALLDWGGLDRARLASLDDTWSLVHPQDLPAL